MDLEIYAFLKTMPVLQVIRIMDLEISVFLKMITVQQDTKMMAEEL